MGSPQDEKGEEALFPPIEIGRMVQEFITPGDRTPCGLEYP